MKRPELEPFLHRSSRPKALLIDFELSPWMELKSCPREYAKRCFTSGYDLDRAGRREEAIRTYRSTIDTLEEWHVREPQTFTKFLLASLAMEHGARLMRLMPFSSFRLQEAHAAFRTASLNADLALANGSSSDCVEVLATSLAWFGLSSRCLGNLEDSFCAYRRSAKLWRHLFLFGKSEQRFSAYERALAAALFGASRTLNLLGQSAEAKRCRTESKSLFQKSRTSVC